MIITDEIKNKIARLAEKHTLTLVVLFGSQATGRVHSSSDIDIAVLGNHKIDRLSIGAELEELFERNDLEVVDLSMASPTLMYVIVEDGILLYETQEDYFFDWKMHAIRTWMETSWLRRMRDKKMLEGVPVLT